MSKRSRVPEPVLVEERVTGTLAAIAEGEDAALFIGLDPPPTSPIITRCPAVMVIRFAIPFIVPPADAMVPGLFISERGGMLTGRECWDYLQTRFQMHPRADVIGLSIRGVPAQARVRDLDFGAAVRVMAYADPPDVTPLAEVKILYVADAIANEVPELVRRYLRHA